MTPAAAVTDPNDRLSQIIEDADRCVKCAACLPYCPTYGISGNEAESPRGRIALARALADGTAAAGDGLTRHLDQCLACRSCEPVCPARVPYGRLLDNARAELARRRPVPRLKRLGLAVARRRRAVRMLARIARLARRAGVDRLIPAARRLPAMSKPKQWRPRAAAGEPRGKVALFVGCVADPLDAETREAASCLLAACGYGVTLPPEQTCCGALHQHAGDDSAAADLAECNRGAFANAEHVVSTATGCGAQLQDSVFGEGRHSDIGALLARDGRIRELTFDRLEARVAVHVPCTQRNVLGDTGSGAALLGLIPGLSVEPLPGLPRCCGAAGSYVLEHGGIADRLAGDMLAPLLPDPPDYLATANMGCALHLADHLQRAGARTRVLHPVTLLARQLR